MALRFRRGRGIRWSSLLAVVAAIIVWMVPLEKKILYGWSGRYVQIYGGLVMFGGYSGKYRQLIKDGGYVGKAFPSPKWVPEFHSYPMDWSLSIPTYLIVWLTLLASILLWLPKRRPRPGHCQNCGYNLTGNTSGHCSECNEPVPTTPLPPADKRASS